MDVCALVFPSRCGGCGVLGTSPCASCVDRLRPLDEIDVGAPVDRCLVLVAYDGVARRLVARLKFGGVRAGVDWFAEAMAARVVAAGERPDVVAWVPAAPVNRRRRGFDQGELVARSVAARLGSSPRRLVVRRGRGTQTGRSRAERLAGPPMEVADPEGAAGATVLLVDDVVTTGASLRRAATVLRAAGARRVVGSAIAHAQPSAAVASGGVGPLNSG